MRLAGKIAFITGAASGMGASTAKLFAKEGAKVVVADMLRAEGEDVVSTIQASGGEARFCLLDVTDETNWAQAVAEAAQAYGPINVLVNNAGISGSAFADVTDTDAWDKLITVNASGTFFGIKTCGPHDGKQRRWCHC